MGTQFILIDRDAPYILPVCIQDYLPEDQMARFVVDIVDQLDLRTLFVVYADKGKRQLSSGDAVSIVILRLRNWRIFQSQAGESHL